jgi:membrane-bound ClpP family serine protease
MFFLGALFFHIGFPVSLLTPIFDAFGGAFLVSLLISLIVLVEEYVPIGIGSFLENISIIISALVFVAIILFGYMSVLSESHRKRHRHFPERRSHEEVTEEIEEEEPVSEKPKRKRRVVRRRVTR